jgi:hypothetical protein
MSVGKGHTHPDRPAGAPTSRKVCWLFSMPPITPFSYSVVVYENGILARKDALFDVLDALSQAVFPRLPC